jgi:hypothetical protein
LEAEKNKYDQLLSEMQRKERILTKRMEEYSTLKETLEKNKKEVLQQAKVEAKQLLDQPMHALHRPLDGTRVFTLAGAPLRIVDRASTHDQMKRAFDRLDQVNQRDAIGRPRQLIAAMLSAR